MENVAQVINWLVNEFDYNSYLEVGIWRGKTFKRVQCLHKSWVDPTPPEYVEGDGYLVTSDEFFKSHTGKYDVIFIDGLHHSEQVERDITNSLDHLSDNGIIILHDCNPQEEINQIVPKKVARWNGDVWKAWVKFRAIFGNTHPTCTINMDEGLGIILKGVKPTKGEDLTPGVYSLEWKEFEKNRNRYLNLVSEDEFKNWIYKHKRKNL